MIIESLDAKGNLRAEIVGNGPFKVITTCLGVIIRKEDSSTVISWPTSSVRGGSTEFYSVD